MASKQEIENNVVEAMTKMVELETSAPFSFSLVPSKPLAIGGLGASWPGWYAMLVHLVDRYLPDEMPYSGLGVDVMLVDRTYNKNLRSLRHWMVERLLLKEKYRV